MSQDQIGEVRNEVTVEGVVISKSISLRQTNSGTYTTNFTIETKEAGRGPVPVGVKAFGALAKECHYTLAEGERIIIKGELASSPHQKVEVKAKTITFLGNLFNNSPINEAVAA
ncbi:single-stranded DNA-binding protein (plasmid) [Trichlorobacter lovleyi]|uniref:single-stranded DNA-binding protein n=1 Tax=Trichlorobacter lovleyi TaxID=313985 RepID=UPI00223EC628|nr:single-stranded DNA-binding protein [Trichlorobacter lovleyi]QOX80783.1 single-stranded DNA-binding protein [Trichlorobacter lovleyi]